MNQLEVSLCKKFNRKYGVYTGNGTTAMYIAFSALGLQSKKVLFPGISCTNPVNAAIYAGYDVDFCDITIENFTIDTDKMQEMLNTGAYGIVVPTHIYGQHCDMKLINEICNKNDVVVIEDAAQTYRVENSTISIMSFGHTKIFETNIGGGIAFTDSEEVYNSMVNYRKLVNARPDNADELFDEYRKKYYSIVDNSVSEYEKNTRLKQLQIESKKYFIYNEENNSELKNILDNSDVILKERVERKKLYDNLLDKKFFYIPENKEDVLWRYTFLYKGNRDKLLDDARKEGIDISSWYPALNSIYKNKSLKNSDRLQNEVVNLWVTADHDIDRIKKEINILNKLMEENTYG